MEYCNACVGSSFVTLSKHGEIACDPSNAKQIENGFMDMLHIAVIESSSCSHQAGAILHS